MPSRRVKGQGVCCKRINQNIVSRETDESTGTRSENSSSYMRKQVRVLFPYRRTRLLSRQIA
jgi:hypothetical protein